MLTGIFPKSIIEILWISQCTKAGCRKLVMVWHRDVIGTATPFVTPVATPVTTSATTPSQSLSQLLLPFRRCPFSSWSFTTFARSCSIVAESCLIVARSCKIPSFWALYSVQIDGIDGQTNPHLVEKVTMLIYRVEKITTVWHSFWRLILNNCSYRHCHTTTNAWGLPACRWRGVSWLASDGWLKFHYWGNDYDRITWECTHVMNNIGKGHTQGWGVGGGYM